MRPIQWHFKINWRVPKSLEKVIPVPMPLHPHLKWWLVERNVLQGQPLHPLKHALQIFTATSKEGWGTHLNKHTVRGTWSLLESKIHPDLVCQETGNSPSSTHPGWLNMIADKLSRLVQTIQTEWSFHPEVFQAICSCWH